MMNDSVIRFYGIRIFILGLATIGWIIWRYIIKPEIDNVEARQVFRKVRKHSQYTVGG